MPSIVYSLATDIVQKLLYCILFKRRKCWNRWLFKKKGPFKHLLETTTQTPFFSSFSEALHENHEDFVHPTFPCFVNSCTLTNETKLQQPSLKKLIPRRLLSKSPCSHNPVVEVFETLAFYRETAAGPS